MDEVYSHKDLAILKVKRCIDEKTKKIVQDSIEGKMNA